MKELCTIYNNCRPVGKGRYLERGLDENQIASFGEAINKTNIPKDAIRNSLAFFLDELIDFKDRDSLFTQVTWKTNSHHLVSVMKNKKVGGFDIVIGTEKSYFPYNKILQTLKDSCNYIK